MNFKHKKILTNMAILGIAAVIIGGLVGTGFLISYVTDKKYHDDNTFDVKKDGMMMIAADDPVNDIIHYSCLNKDKNKMMTVDEFESDTFTAYKLNYLNSGWTYLDDDGNKMKNEEIHSYFLEKAVQYKNQSNFIVYETASDYLFSYESDYRPGAYSAFNLNFYNAEKNSLSLIRTYNGREVVKLKILSDLKKAFS